MRKLMIIAVLLLTLTLLTTIPVVAKKPPLTPGPGPPPPEERCLVTFSGSHITSEPLELLISGVREKGGKHLTFTTPQGEYSALTFTEDIWGRWKGLHEGKIRLSIDVKFKEVDLIFFFDYEYEPLDFWRLKSTDEGNGEWIPDEEKGCFSNDPFEIWRYSDQGDTTILRLTFDVTIEPIP